MSLNDHGNIFLTISKSENKNIVLYEVVCNKNDSSKPQKIHGFWEMRERSGEIEELNWFEKRFGYGVNIIEVMESEIVFNIVSLKDYHMTVKQIGDQFRAISQIDDQMVVVENIYIEVTSHIVFKPIIHSLTINGYILSSNEPFSKRIEP